MPRMVSWTAEATKAASRGDKSWRWYALPTVSSDCIGPAPIVALARAIGVLACVMGEVACAVLRMATSVSTDFMELACPGAIDRTAMFVCAA